VGKPRITGGMKEATTLVWKCFFPFLISPFIPS
jgi:hypothetical protein